MRQTGFTLLELLMVIAIIGVLAVLVFVAARSARDKAEDARVQAAISQLRRVVEEYYNDNNGYQNWDLCVATPTAANCVSQSIANSVITLKSEIQAANGQSNSLTVLAGAKSFCMIAPIVTNPTQGACSDATGKSALTPLSPGCKTDNSGPVPVYSCS